MVWSGDIQDLRKSCKVRWCMNFTVTNTRLNKTGRRDERRTGGVCKAEGGKRAKSRTEWREKLADKRWRRWLSWCSCVDFSFLQLGLCTFLEACLSQTAEKRRPPRGPQTYTHLHKHTPPLLLNENHIIMSSFCCSEQILTLKVVMLRLTWNKSFS